MLKDNNTPGTALATVGSIADARAKKKDADEESPYEACEPQAVRIQDDDWHITGCDGEQTYIWLARKKTKRSKSYTVTEVYPGMTKKSTDLRDVKESIDLEMTDTADLKTISDVLEDLSNTLFADFMVDENETGEI